MTQTSCFRIAPSLIHGNGVIASRDLERGELVGLAIRLHVGVFPNITAELGRWLNHSDHPNAILLWEPAHGGHVIRTASRIAEGQEILVNYHDSPWYVDKACIDGSPRAVEERKDRVLYLGPFAGGRHSAKGGCSCCSCNELES